MTTIPTAGTVFDRAVAQALAAGLVVEFDDSRSDDVIQSVSATVMRPQVEVANAYDRYQNSRRVYLQAVRCFNRGRWTNHIHYSSAGTTTLVDLRVNEIRYAIADLAD